MKTINKVTSEKLSCMTTDLLQMPKRLLALACMACLTSVCVLAQSKFHVDLDYNYNLGLSQRFAGHTMSRKDFSMGGHALQLAGRYDVLPQLSAGLGVGAARYTEFDFNTFPVFATLRYKPIKSLRQAYLFTNVGYAVKVTDASTPGFTGKLGIGYTVMLARHFGLNFSVAYDYKDFRKVEADIENPSTGDYDVAYKTCNRHSVSFGVGFTF